jgi:hypothetical protein
MASIKSFIINNLAPIIIIVFIVFLGLLFYTNLIIHHNNMSPTNQPQTQHQTLSTNLETVTKNEKHVSFDANKNQEIVYETGNGNLDSNDLNIDYENPENNELQRISKCSYPMNNEHQRNIKDCTVTNDCIQKFPQQWFKDQRAAKKDLPGYSGSLMAEFSFPENQTDCMMRNMIYDKNETDAPSHHLKPQTMESFNGFGYEQAQEKPFFHNVPFNNAIEMRGAQPTDLCRNCVVGVCNNDVCGSQINQYGNLPNYYLD